MIKAIEEGPLHPSGRRAVTTSLKVASSTSLPLLDRVVDFVLTSPPYCTRIDYAMATAIELAVLGYGSSGGLGALRRQLIGTSTVPAEVPEASAAWGPSCCEFMQKVAGHRAKASGTYYYKNHAQYFTSISQSLAELGRVLNPGGTCVLVAQDSYYKDVHNDLPQIFVEMASAHGLKLVRREDFRLAATMARVNPRARQYRSRFNATESVLCLSKE
jgi:tRNA G10  N-methylase Trm11